MSNLAELFGFKFAANIVKILRESLSLQSLSRLLAAAPKFDVYACVYVFIVTVRSVCPSHDWTDFGLALETSPQTLGHRDQVEKAAREARESNP